jgi:hypothetical protein
MTTTCQQHEGLPFAQERTSCKPRPEFPALFTLLLILLIFSPISVLAEDDPEGSESNQGIRRV